MKRQQQKQLLDIFGNFTALHNQIEISKRSDNTEDVCDLLSSCQEIAIQIGEAIEAIEGSCDDKPDFKKIITSLEAYCEELYIISTNYEEYKERDLYTSLENKISEARDFLGCAKVRYDAVFLPYKADMWDSLESEWKKLNANPDYDTYVVPIPYYDKKADRTLGLEHYEGDKYPEYVPITDYRAINLELMHPDEIYIHNPYDEYNIVTSVHPDYYCVKLVNYTDNLTYIPYFVLEDPDPDNEESLNAIEHFVSVPGVIYSHHVIVQSEKMAKAYINILVDMFSKVNGKERATKEFWEKRILGLGSPKIDKIIESSKQPKVIPKEWMPIVSKPDGSYKKIILYNTGLGAMLNGKDKMIDKIRRAFKIFYESRDDVALLWRPHPLIKQTIETMLPDLWSDYSKIVEEYKEAGWGIYDDSPDLDRALVVSDAYYGDPSSLVTLYKETGKPIMIQSADV